MLTNTVFSVTVISTKEHRNNSKRGNEREVKSMSYYTMSNKELSQLIRKELKENGFTSKDVSVRVRSALYDTSVQLTVKNPLVRLSEVETVTKKFSKVERCERTGEILAGCNVYVHCQYESGIFNDVAAPLLPIAERVLNNEKYNGRKIAENDKTEVHMIKINNLESHLYEYQKDTKQRTTESYILHFAGDLAVAMWRYKNIGTIYA